MMELQGLHGLIIVRIYDKPKLAFCGLDYQTQNNYNLNENVVITTT